MKNLKEKIRKCDSILRAAKDGDSDILSQAGFFGFDEAGEIVKAAAEAVRIKIAEIKEQAEREFALL